MRNNKTSGIKRYSKELSIYIRNYGKMRTWRLGAVKHDWRTDELTLMRRLVDHVRVVRRIQNRRIRL